MYNIIFMITIKHYPENINVVITISIKNCFFNLITIKNMIKEISLNFFFNLKIIIINMIIVFVNLLFIFF